MNVTEGELNLRPATTYLSNLSEGRLTYQRCAECEAAVFYPRMLCPHCGGVDLAWEASRGHGTVYSVTTLPKREGDSTVVALVDLDEGYRMMSWLVGDGATRAAIGQRVSAQFEIDADVARVVFTLEAPNV
jgi:uncharacterized OB-fold protein